MTMSSPIGVFSMINQFQLLFLLPVSGVYLSYGVINLIIGMKITLLDFNFFKVKDISFINIIKYIK